MGGSRQKCGGDLFLLISKPATRPNGEALRRSLLELSTLHHTVGLPNRNLAKHSRYPFTPKYRHSGSDGSFAVAYDRPKDAPQSRSTEWLHSFPCNVRVNPSDAVAVSIHQRVVAIHIKPSCITSCR